MDRVAELMDEAPQDDHGRGPHILATWLMVASLAVVAILPAAAMSSIAGAAVLAQRCAG